MVSNKSTVNCDELEYLTIANPNRDKKIKPNDPRIHLFRPHIAYVLRMKIPDETFRKVTVVIQFMNIPEIAKTFKRFATAQKLVIAVQLEFFIRSIITG